MTPQERALMFVGYEMYYKGLTKQELDGLTGFQLLIEMDEFGQWLADGIPKK